MVKEVSDSLATYNTNANTVNVSAISRLQVLAIDQWFQFTLTLVFVNNGVDAEMLLGDTGIVNEEPTILLEQHAVFNGFKTYHLSLSLPTRTSSPE